MDPVVIVGASHAGVELAFALRRLGHDTPVKLLDEGTDLPYQRPPLSKALLLNDTPPAGVPLRPASAYVKAGIELVGGARVSRIDPGGHRVELASGAQIRYSKLAVTAGGRVRRLAQLDERPAGNTFYLRNLADGRALREHWRTGARLAIIGGGYIGLEVAAAAARRGLHVTVIESQPRVLARVTSPEMSAFFQRLHADAGVQLLTGARFDRFEYASGDRIARIHCTDTVSGAPCGVDADLVVVGIGMQPNSELAAEAGLSTGDGILVDEFATTSDNDIVAAGDCTSHPNPFVGRRLRLESVQNAVEQARAAAATLCGRPQPYHAVPWFWSDQYDVKLQTAGLAQGYDRIVRRGDPQARSFCVFYLQHDRLIAADMVNRPKEFMATRRLLAERSAVSAPQLADEAVDLAALLHPAPHAAPLAIPGAA